MWYYGCIEIVNLSVYVTMKLILEILCEELSNPENGTVSLPSQRTVDSIATYACNDSFELVGATNVMCQLNGTWSAEEPRCIGMSVYPPFLTNCLELKKKKKKKKT